MNNWQIKFSICVPYGQLVPQVTNICNTHPTSWPSFQPINYPEILIKSNLYQ